MSGCFGTYPNRWRSQFLKKKKEMVERTGDWQYRDKERKKGNKGENGQCGDATKPEPMP